MGENNSVFDPKRAAVEFLRLVAAGDIDAAYRDYVAMDGRHHNPFFPAGFPALQKAMKEAHVQFPHKTYEVKKVIGEGYLVAVHAHLCLEPGTPGLIVLHILRFRDEKIREMWDMSQPVPADSVNVDGVF